MSQETKSPVSAIGRLGTERIGKLLLEFSVPAVAGMFVNAIYNIVDRIYIGQGVDPLGIGGVGIVMPIMLFAGVFGILIGAGANTLFAIKLGEGRAEEVEKIMGHAIAMLFIVGTAGMVATLVFMEPLLKNVLGVSDQMYPYSKTYLTIIQYGMPINAMGMGLTHFIRSDGHPKTSMLVQIAGAVTNIILDPILIFGFNMGVAGAAWATVFSHIVTWVLIIWYFNSPWTNLRFRLKKMIPTPSLTGRIMALGFAPSVMMMAMSLVGILQNIQILKYGGDEALTAMTITFSITAMVIMPIQGIGQGAQPILGYNYGAKNYGRVKHCFKLELKASACVLTVGFLVAELIPGLCFRLFSRDMGSLRDLTLRTIRIVVMMFPLVAFQLAGGQFFQAMGKPIQATIVSLSRQILFFIPCLLFLPLVWRAFDANPVEGVFFTFPISDGLSSILSCIFIKSEFSKWAKLETGADVV